MYFWKDKHRLSAMIALPHFLLNPHNVICHFKIEFENDIFVKKLFHFVLNKKYDLISHANIWLISL